MAYSNFVGITVDSIHGDLLRPFWFRDAGAGAARCCHAASAGGFNRRMVGAVLTGFVLPEHRDGGRSRDLRMAL
eukprot:s2283_g5.t1